MRQMAQVSLQSAGWLSARLLRAQFKLRSVMTLLAQVVVLSWEEGGEQEEQELYDIQLDGSGRLDWAAVKETFHADTVKITGRGSPSVLKDGEWKGFTLRTFQPGSTILVTVSRTVQGENKGDCQEDILCASDPPEASDGSSALPLGSGNLHGVLWLSWDCSEAMAHNVMRRLGMHDVVPARAA